MKYTKNKNKTNYITSGTKSLEEMIQSAEESNEMWTWVMRILGTILVCLALKMLFGILVTLLKVVPFLASILNWGVSLICNILGVVYALIIIAVAVTGSFIYWGASRKKKNNQLNIN